MTQLFNSKYTYQTYTVYRKVHKFEEIDNVKDLQTSGRPKTEADVD